MGTEAPVFVNPLPNAMKNGFTLGLLFSANFLLSVAQSAIVQLLTYLIIAFILVFTLRCARNFRDNESGGQISFYRCFSYIFLLFFFAALISAAVKLVYLNYINTDYLPRLVEATKKTMEQLKIEVPANSEDFFSIILHPSQFIMQTVMADTMLGAMLGLLYAPFLKKTKD
ncbi:MAG: DUF4199 domain-containing protein [Paludibacteraceae bacterium]|nr:DUF4199 domain-containing protein [Paludibacteraceae bacterium]